VTLVVYANLHQIDDREELIEEPDRQPRDGWRWELLETHFLPHYKNVLVCVWREVR